MDRKRALGRHWERQSGTDSLPETSEYCHSERTLWENASFCSTALNQARKKKRQTCSQSSWNNFDFKLCSGKCQLYLSLKPQNLSLPRIDLFMSYINSILFNEWDVAHYTAVLHGPECVQYCIYVWVVIKCMMPIKVSISYVFKIWKGMAFFSSVNAKKHKAW